jgi:hypothetical protein
MLFFVTRHFVKEAFMNPDSDRRTDSHLQVMVDTGVVLQRAYGDEYARCFLESMHIPEQVIIRVLARDMPRFPKHRDLFSLQSGLLSERNGSDAIR